MRKFEVKTGLSQESVEHFPVHFGDGTYFKEKSRRGTHKQDLVSRQSGNNFKRQRRVTMKPKVIG